MLTYREASWKGPATAPEEPRSCPPRGGRQRVQVRRIRRPRLRVRHRHAFKTHLQRHSSLIPLPSPFRPRQFPPPRTVPPDAVPFLATASPPSKAREK